MSGPRMAALMLACMAVPVALARAEPAVVYITGIGPTDTIYTIK